MEGGRRGRGESRRGKREGEEGEGGKLLFTEVEGVIAVESRWRFSCNNLGEEIQRMLKQT